MRYASAFTVAFLMAVSTASAATLSSIEGEVLVNTGNGFAKATAEQQLKTGDRVMIGARGGKASVAYDPACAEQVERGFVVTVKPFAPCGATDSGDGRGSIKDDRAAGGVVGGGGSLAGAAAPAAGLPTAAVVAVGVAVAVGAGVLIHKATKPSSP